MDHREKQGVFALIAAIVVVMIGIMVWRFWPEGDTEPDTQPPPAVVEPVENDDEG